MAPRSPGHHGPAPGSARARGWEGRTRPVGAGKGRGFLSSFSGGVCMALSAFVSVAKFSHLESGKRGDKT